MNWSHSGELPLLIAGWYRMMLSIMDTECNKNPHLGGFRDVIVFLKILNDGGNRTRVHFCRISHLVLTSVISVSFQGIFHESKYVKAISD